MGKILIGKKKGSSSIVFSLMIIFVLVLYLMGNFSIQSNKLISSKIDSTFTGSLLGSAVINLSEYGRTHQISIFDDLPNEYNERSAIINDVDTIYIQSGDNEIFKDNVAGSAEFSVSRNNYLNKSLNIFKDLLKANMVLDDSYIPIENDNMNSVLKSKYIDEDGAKKDNRVSIDEYTVINVYTYREAEAPYTEHTYTCVYRCTDGYNFYMVDALSGKDIETVIDSENPNWSSVVKNGKVDGTVVKSTTVYARISFYTDIWLSNEGIEKRSVKHTIDRVVSIEKR